MKDFPWALLKFVKTHSTEMQMKYCFREGHVYVSKLNHSLVAVRIGYKRNCSKSLSYWCQACSLYILFCHKRGRTDHKHAHTHCDWEKEFSWFHCVQHTHSKTYMEKNQLKKYLFFFSRLLPPAGVTQPPPL